MSKELIYHVLLLTVLAILGAGLQCCADRFGARGRDLTGGQGGEIGNRQGEAHTGRGAETGESHVRAHVWLSP